MYSVLSVVVCWEIKTEFYCNSSSRFCRLNSTVTRIILNSSFTNKVSGYILQQTKNYVYPVSICQVDDYKIHIQSNNLSLWANKCFGSSLVQLKSNINDKSRRVWTLPQFIIHISEKHSSFISGNVKCILFSYSIEQNLWTAT